MNKKKAIATACMGGCAGCHISLLDMDKELIDLLEKADIKASHMIVDTKEFPEVDIGIVEGSMTNEENVEVVESLREKCDILIALGDCACLGGINTSRNFGNVDECLKISYKEKADTESEMPSDDWVPSLLEKVTPVDRYVSVDAYIPGCPPSTELIKYGLEEALKGKVPKVPEEKLEYD